MSEFREDADGFWHLGYSGGTADDWLSDVGKLKTVLVRVSYEDGTDGRGVRAWAGSSPGDWAATG